MKLGPAQIVRDYRYIFSLLLYYFPADNWCLLRGGAGRGAGEILIYISGILGCGLWWYSASDDWDLYNAALPDYKLFSRINTFESILSRSAAEIMGNWHTGNLSNSELKTNIFVSDGDSPTARLKTVKTNTNLSINVSR